jgi:hypothetical protein
VDKPEVISGVLIKSASQEIKNKLAFFDVCS